MPSWAQTARASSLNNRSQPYLETSSRLRPSLKRLNRSAQTPGRNNRSRGLLAKNCGVNDKGRLANPKPLTIIPAMASPVVISSWSWGGTRASIISMMPNSLITEATTPRWSRRSTLTDSIGTPPDCMALSQQDVEGRVYDLFSFCTCSMSGIRYLDNVTLANPQLREGRIAWAEAPSSLWEDPEFSETVRRNLPWNRATS